MWNPFRFPRVIWEQDNVDFKYQPAVLLLRVFWLKIPSVGTPMRPRATRHHQRRSPVLFKCNQLTLNCTRINLTSVLQHDTTRQVLQLRVLMGIIINKFSNPISYLKFLKTPLLLPKFQLALFLTLQEEAYRQCITVWLAGAWMEKTSSHGNSSRIPLWHHR